MLDSRRSWKLSLEGLPKTCRNFESLTTFIATGRANAVRRVGSSSPGRGESSTPLISGLRRSTSRPLLDIGAVKRRKPKPIKRLSPNIVSKRPFWDFGPGAEGLPRGRQESRDLGAPALPGRLHGSEVLALREARHALLADRKGLLRDAKRSQSSPISWRYNFPSFSSCARVSASKCRCLTAREPRGSRPPQGDGLPILPLTLHLAGRVLRSGPIAHGERGLQSHQRSRSPESAQAHTPEEHTDGPGTARPQ